MIDLVPYALRQNFRIVKSHKWGKDASFRLIGKYTSSSQWSTEFQTQDEQRTLIVQESVLDDYVSLLDILQDNFHPFDILLEQQFRIRQRTVDDPLHLIRTQSTTNTFGLLPANVQIYLHFYAEHFKCSFSNLHQRNNNLIVVSTSNRNCPVRRGDAHATNHMCLMVDLEKKIVFEFCWDRECQNELQRKNLHWTDHVYTFTNPFTRNFDFDFKFSL
ncbi:MAG: hypothetical protein GY861_22870 [bacterium]|nr:hypothetical protein [bacterium]